MIASHNLIPALHTLHSHGYGPGPAHARMVVQNRLKDLCVWCNLQQQTTSFEHKLKDIRHERLCRSLHRQHDRPEAVIE